MTFQYTATAKAKAEATVKAKVEGKRNFSIVDSMKILKLSNR